MPPGGCGPATGDGVQHGVRSQVGGGTVTARTRVRMESMDFLAPMGHSIAYAVPQRKSRRRRAWPRVTPRACASLGGVAPHFF